MARIKSLLLLAAAGTALAAAPADARRKPHGPEHGLDSLNQPVVQRTDYVIDLGTAGNGVADREVGRLADWFESLRVGYGDRIAVDTGAPLATAY